MSEEGEKEVEQLDNNIQNESQKKKDNKQRYEKLEKLNEYVQEMAYKLTKPQTAPRRTEELAKPHKKHIIANYIDHKNDLKPIERSNRVGEMAKKYELINTDKLKELIETYRKKQNKTEADKKQQQKIYQEILHKLQEQSKDQLMRAIVKKFAKELSKRVNDFKVPNIETESFIRLQNTIICNMFMALKVPKDHQISDYSIYKKLAAVLSDLILQVIFLAHNTNNELISGYEDVQARNTENDFCIQTRALSAAKKKLCSHRRKKCHQ